MRKNFLWFHLYRTIIVKFGLDLFYRKIRVEGLHKVPRKKPLLIIPNHQNSFMDALLITTRLHKTLSFLTRAQAFSHPFMNWYLRSLNMLPVYRVRDGIKNVQKNEEIFQECINRLSNNEAVLIFPEANHDLKRRLRPFSKGFTRIAFDAEAQNNWNLDLQVVPVGLNYSDHRNSRNEVRVVFGKSFPVKSFKKKFEEDQRAASDELKNEVSDRLKPLVMHVSKLDQYPLVKVVLDEMESDRAKLANPNYMNSLVDCLQSRQTPDLIEKAEEVLKIAKEYDLSVRVLINVKLPLLKLGLLSPLYALAWLNGIIPYQPARHIIKTKIKDPAFDASIKFVLSLVIFPVFYLLVSLAMVLLLGVPGVWALGYFTLSLFSSVLFKRAHEFVRTIKEKQKIKHFKQTHPEKYETVQNHLAELLVFRKEVIQGE